MEEDIINGEWLVVNVRFARVLWCIEARLRFKSCASREKLVGRKWRSIALTQELAVWMNCLSDIGEVGRGPIALNER